MKFDFSFVRSTLSNELFFSIFQVLMKICVQFFTLCITFNTIWKWLIQFYRDSSFIRDNFENGLLAFNRLINVYPFVGMFCKRNCLIGISGRKKESKRRLIVFHFFFFFFFSWWEEDDGKMWWLWWWLRWLF